MSLTCYQRAKAYCVLRRFFRWLCSFIMPALIFGTLGYAFGGVTMAESLAVEIDQRFICVARDAN